MEILKKEKACILRQKSCDWICEKCELNVPIRGKMEAIEAGIQAIDTLELVKANIGIVNSLVRGLENLPQWK